MQLEVVPESIVYRPSLRVCVISLGYTCIVDQCDKYRDDCSEPVRLLVNGMETFIKGITQACALTMRLDFTNTNASSVLLILVYTKASI